MLKEFIGESGMNSRLVRGVINALNGWNEDTRQNLRDIAEHGIDGGFCGFTYYSDTCAFFRKYREEILDLAENIADDMGIDMFSMVANFNCLKGLSLSPSEIAKALYQGKGECAYQIFNAMTWLAGEEVARRFCDIECESNR